MRSALNICNHFVNVKVYFNAKKIYSRVDYVKNSVINKSILYFTRYHFICLKSSKKPLIDRVLLDQDSVTYYKCNKFFEELFSVGKFCEYCHGKYFGGIIIEFISNCNIVTLKPSLNWDEKKS